MVRLPVCWMEGLQGMECEQLKLFIEDIELYEAHPACEDTKICSKCMHTLPSSAFSTASGGSYLRPECKACASTLTKVRKQLREVHGQPPAGYNCPVCLCDEEQAEGKGGNASAWVLDHDHDTDDFRGWLCHRCNRALGCFHDDVPRLKRAIKYLRGKL